MIAFDENELSHFQYNKFRLGAFLFFLVSFTLLTSSINLCEGSSSFSFYDRQAIKSNFSCVASSIGFSE